MKELHAHKHICILSGLHTQTKHTRHPPAQAHRQPGTLHMLHISDWMQRKDQGNNKCETGYPTLWVEANEYSESNTRRVLLPYQTCSIKVQI